MFARQNTAKTFIVGPVLDSAGAAKTDEVVGNIRVSKNGTVGDPNASSTLTPSHTGKYTYTAAAGDFDTLGEVTFSLNDSTNDMPPRTFQVVPANVYDAMVLGSDYLQVDQVQWKGSAPDDLNSGKVQATASNLPSKYPATLNWSADVSNPPPIGTSTFNPATDTVARVTLVDTCTANTDVAAVDTKVSAVQTILAGITSLANWLRALARKSTPDSTALSEINDGGGTYAATNDSQEAIRDRGDAAWVTGGGGSSSFTVLPITSELTSVGRVPYWILTAYQHCKWTATVAIFDKDNNAVDLSGKTLSLVAWVDGTPATSVFELRSDVASPEITIGGTDSNQVTISAADTRTATARTLKWRLYNTTDDLAMADGEVRIEAGPSAS